MKIKIAIIGASGLVGKSLLKDLLLYFGVDAQVVGTYYNNSYPNGLYLDITNKSKMRVFIDNFRPDILVWLAGSKNIKELESDPSISHLLNEKPIINMLDILKDSLTQTKIIYISSDYVFDGNRGMYTFDDVRSPRTIYGKSKVFVEDMLRDSAVKSVSLRTSAIMSARGGFFSWLLQKIRDGECVDLYSNSIFSPTPSVSFNRAVVRIIQESLWGGELNFAGNAMTRYEFGRKVAEMLGKDPSQITPLIADIENGTFHSDLSLITSDELSDLMPSNEDLIKELGKYD